MPIRSTIVLLAALAAPLPGLAQTMSKVTFPPGKFGTTVSGTVAGDEYLDYLLGAKAGQKMSVELTVNDSNGSGTVYFNILPPGSDGVAIYNGSTYGTSTTLTLPETGTYAIRVYQMGDDKDSGKTSGFNIDLSIQ